MSTRVVDRVEDWGDRSFSGGYRELHNLADREFSGAVRANGAELYMTKGVAVGVRNGRIEDFEDARGTIHEAPSPALPLLAVMQDRSEDVRDKFYSEKTAISEVDSTLSEGGFTGYVELSENVLSGDYFLVYHAGESMSVGFVGESRRLIHGDEAFQTADDEVGIYEVRPVDIEPIDMPEPEESVDTPAEDSGPTVVFAGDSEPADSSTRRSEPADARPGGTDPGDAQPGGGEPSDTQPGTTEPTPSEPGATEVTGQESARETGAAETTGEDGEAGDESGSSTPSGTPSGESRAETGTNEPESQGEREDGDQTAGRPSQEQPTDGSSQASAGPDGTGGANEGLTLERRAIPSLDPARTEESAEQRSQPRQHRAEQRTTPPDTRASDPGSGTTGSQGGTATVGVERIETLETRVEEREQQIEQLETQLDSVTQERDELRDQLDAAREERDQLDAVRAERDQLQGEVERLEGEVDRLEDEIERQEGEIERLEAETGMTAGADRRITRNEALSGTDIFFRYHSKGNATLEKAHGGSTRQEEVNDNLRLEKHTQFDADAVAVDGQSYGESLEGTVEYQFVEWLVRELLFEIRETGHGKGLKNLYDVLPAVDRAELAGVVEATYTADGQETRSQEAFDVILRDRMGNPLLVANMNDSREAATASMMEDLVTSAERVGQSAGEFAGAFLVTRSFFDPGALEVAEEATQGGLLSRDKRESFVNLSRKRGYHLCLVEARNQNFHLAVPEL